MAKKKKRTKRRAVKYSCARRATRPDGTKYCAKFKGRSPNKGRRCLRGMYVIGPKGKPVCMRYSGKHKTEKKKAAAARRRAKRGIEPMFGPVFRRRLAGKGSNRTIDTLMVGEAYRQSVRDPYAGMRARYTASGPDLF